MKQKKPFNLNGWWLISNFLSSEASLYSSDGKKYIPLYDSRRFAWRVINETGIRELRPVQASSGGLAIIRGLTPLAAGVALIREGGVELMTFKAEEPEDDEEPKRIYYSGDAGR